MTHQHPDQQTRMLIGILGYIVPILFFLPLVIDSLKSDSFARYHANQQLLLLLFWVAGNVIAQILVVFVIGIFLIPLVSLAGLIFIILGIVNVAQGKTKPLPVIGEYTLIK